LFPYLSSLDRVKDPEYIQQISKLKSKIKEYNNGILYYSFMQIVKKAEKDSNNKSGYLSVLWNICRYLANYGISPDDISNKYFMHYSKNRTSVNKDMPKNWNILLRKLGYSGFNDDGVGYIHPNEPIQTVFMGTNFINKIKLILNQDFGILFNNYDEAVAYINAKVRVNNNILSDKVIDYLKSVTRQDMHLKQPLFIAIAYALQNNDLSKIDIIIDNDKHSRRILNNDIIAEYEKYYKS